MYSIGEFAKLINVTTQTLRNWDKENKLKPIILESGHRRYTDEHFNLINGIKESVKINVIYCRESTKMQKESLKLQEEKIKEFCISNGITIDKVISEFGSVLNYKRQGLLELIDLITKNKVENLIIYYKDRLVRFGYELFEELSKKYNFKILIIDSSESNKSKEKEFADDLISIIHYFSMKLYGSRSYKQKIKKAEDNLIQIKQEIE
jgi:predicted site-specific integrase-resolvase